MSDVKAGRGHSANPYEELIRLHFGLEESREPFPTEPAHHEPSLRDSPAHRHAIALLSTRVPKSSARRSGHSHMMKLRQEELWPRELASSLAHAASAFYTHVHQSDLSRLWMVTAHRVISREQLQRLSRLESIVSNVNRRLEAVERGRWVELAELPSLKSGSTAADTLVAEVKRYDDVVAGIFAESFGQLAQVKVRPSETGDDLPVTVILDASAADPTVMQRRRLEGARAAFYERIATELPAHLVDQSNFEFVFPADANS